MHKQQNWYLYNMLDRFRYHQKRWYWPDTDTAADAIMRFGPHTLSAKVDIMGTITCSSSRQKSPGYAIEQQKFT